MRIVSKGHETPYEAISSIGCPCLLIVVLEEGILRKTTPASIYTFSFCHILNHSLSPPDSPLTRRSRSSGTSLDISRSICEFDTLHT